MITPITFSSATICSKLVVYVGLCLVLFHVLNDVISHYFSMHLQTIDVKLTGQ